MIWIKAHWLHIAAMLYAALVILATVAIRNLPKDSNGRALPPADWKQFLWHFGIDLLALLPRPGMTGAFGSVNLPLLPSWAPGESKLPPTPPAAALILFLVLSSCVTPGGQAFGKCELGELPQNSQTVIACAEGAITSPADWQAVLLSCGSSLLPGQLECIVSAIVAASERRMSSHPKAAIGSVDELVVQRGRAWLAEHAPKACGERVRQ